jgi:hypothetical protein
VNKQTITTLLFLLFAFNINAAVFRVNNTGADADFTGIQAAHDAAMAGDSLYIEASPSSYGNIIISKEIHIFGPGYRLSENQNLQANVTPASVDLLYLTNGCDGTTIQGMSITHSVTNSGAAATFGDVVISRNQIVGGVRFNTTGSIDDVFIIGNEIWGSYNGYNSITTTGASPKNLIVLNNIFRYTSYAYISLSATTTAIFTNNVFTGRTITTTNCDFQNNILVAGTIANPNANIFSYNISTGTEFPSGNNNQQNVNNASIFVGWPSIGGYSEDGRFELLPGSPAEGAGNGGVDCGVFGGPSPYILSGIPPIPTIYKFESPNVVTGNFTITLSTRSNN